MIAHWKAARVLIKSEWSRLTDADCDAIDAEYDRLIDRIRELYRTGATIMLEAEVKGKVNRFLERF